MDNEPGEMMDEREKVCQHPECKATKIVLRLGPLKEPFCVDHIDYGMGRAFGPLHWALDAAQRMGIGGTDED